MQETQEMRVPSLGREDPMEEEMATHSSILAWDIPWTEEPGGFESLAQKAAKNDKLRNPPLQLQFFKFWVNYPNVSKLKGASRPTDWLGAPWARGPPSPSSLASAGGEGPGSACAPAVLRRLPLRQPGSWGVLAHPAAAESSTLLENSARPPNKE